MRVCDGCGNRVPFEVTKKRFMEAESRRRSSRRQPLSDCTNTTLAGKAIASVAGGKKHSAKCTVIETSSPPSDIIKHQKPISSSTKSNTSAGSNNPNDLSRLPSASPKPHALLQSRSGSGSRDHEETGPAAVWIHSQDACKRKDKGSKVAEDPISWCSNDTEKTGPADFQIQRQNVKTRIYKGKMVLGGPVVEHGCENEKSISVHIQRQDAVKIKDKGKMVAEYHHSGPDYGPRVLRSQGKDAKVRKDKGKMLAEGLLVEQGGRSHGPPVLHIQNQDELIRKNKGKMVAVDYTNNHDGHNHETAGPTAVQLSEQEERVRKDKGKMIGDDCFNEPSQLSVPCSISLQLSAASASSYLSTPRHEPHVLSASSGTTEHLKPENQTIYARKRAPQGRGYKGRSCPPAKQNKEKRYDYNRNNCQSGSFTDPIPVRKKKRSNKQSSVHAMSQDEVEKLRAYYAEIDAFDLPEEMASDND